jgi:uncharacterized Zn finger protein
MWYGRSRSRNNSRYGSFYPEYVPVAERKARAAKQAAKLAKKKGSPLKPVVLEGRKIAQTYWGKAWCDNIESYQDFAYRLERGRTYVRNGSVIDLDIQKGKITALVAGSGASPYEINIQIAPLAKARWEALKKACTNKIDSLLSLAQGKLPEEVLKRFCDKAEGLFPSPKEMKMTCDCPDIAGLCKHLAAVLYGVGARLDQEPKLFFVLRGVHESELIGGQAVDVLTAGTAAQTAIAAGDLADVFGVDFDMEVETKPEAVKKSKRAKATAAPVKESGKKKAAPAQKVVKAKKATPAKKAKVPSKAKKSQ